MLGSQFGLRHWQEGLRRLRQFSLTLAEIGNFLGGSRREADPTNWNHWSSQSQNCFDLVLQCFAALSDQGFSLSEYLHLLAGPRTTGRSAQVRISVVLVDAHDSYDRLVFLATAKRQPQTAPCLRAIFASLTRFPIPSGQWAQAYQRTVRASRSFQPCKVDQGGM